MSRLPPITMPEAPLLINKWGQPLNMLSLAAVLLLQVTHRLSTIVIHAFQQPDPSLKVPLLAANALNLWLSHAAAATATSPAPRAAATVRQQLQESQLLQHLGPAMDAAAARLTAALAALAEAEASVFSSSCTAGGSATQQASAGVLLQHIYVYSAAETCCQCLLKTFRLACYVLAPTGGVHTAPAVMPAAPAAVRMILTIFQVLRSRQQLQQQRPGPVTKSPETLEAMLSAMIILTAACEAHDDVTSMLQSCPAASELVQLPEFVSCLAIMVVATALGVDTSSDGGMYAASTLVTSSSGGVGTTTGRQGTSTEIRQQQQPAQQADRRSRSRHAGGSSGGAPSSGSGSGGAGAGSSGTGLSNGVRLDSLTPLSCSLFDILAVTREIVLQFARLANSRGFTTPVYSLGSLKIYSSVIDYQVTVYVEVSNWSRSAFADLEACCQDQLFHVARQAPDLGLLTA
jgi:hypothetical protein